MTSEEKATVQKLFDHIVEEMDVELKSFRNQTIAPGAEDEYTRSFARIRRTIRYAIDEFRKMPSSSSS